MKKKDKKKHDEVIDDIDDKLNKLSTMRKLAKMAANVDFDSENVSGKFNLLYTTAVEGSKVFGGPAHFMERILRTKYELELPRGENTYMSDAIIEVLKLVELESTGKITKEEMLEHVQ